MIFLSTLSAITYYLFFDGSTVVREFKSNVWNMFNALGNGNGTDFKPVSTLNTENVAIYAKNTGEMNAMYISGTATSDTNAFITHSVQFLLEQDLRSALYWRMNFLYIIWVIITLEGRTKLNLLDFLEAPLLAEC